MIAIAIIVLIYLDSLFKFLLWVMNFNSYIKMSSKDYK